MSRQRVDLEQLKHNIYVVKLLANRDRQRSNSSAFLGQMWQIINPFIYMVVMALLFTKMFSNDNFKYYQIYILIGTMINALFNEGTASCLTALSGNKNFLINASISRELYPIERVYVAFVNFCFSVAIFILVALYYGLYPRLEWLFIVPNIILFTTMILGIGKILAIINVVFADITYFYKIFTLFVFYSSAIFYDTARLSPIMKKLMLLNPEYVSITIIRSIVIYKRMPQFYYWGILGAYAVILYLVGTYVYRKNIQNIIEKI